MQAWPYGVLVVLMLAEAAAGRWWLRRPLYGLRDTEVGLALTIGWLIGSAAPTLLGAAAFAFCYAHRLVTLPFNAFTLVLFVLVADLIDYGFHRASHRLGWLWATHCVHHTAPRMNALASARQGWTDILTGAWLALAPLALLGFPPAALVIYAAVVTVWEALRHNEWTPQLGPLEWILATPSSHRVHHSLKSAHLNRNYGSLLIVWDRLFGTYVAEGELPIRAFGLAGIDDSAGPVWIAFHGWREWAATKVRARRRPGSDQAPATPS
jgi:sterol desaturase/sphingolipid hydroxylase (fatty acid hydroxylase superfamily)